jgi:uncharacterized membrane protein YkvA (DUF1232 family)
MSGDFKKNKKKVSKADLKKASAKLNNVKDDMDPGAIETLTEFISMCWDYISGDYPALPLSSFLSISFAVIYFLSPIDAIPDFLLPFGLVDDAAVTMSVYSFVKGDVKVYRRWKKNNSEKHAA